MEVKLKVWIENDGKHVIGKGGAEILKAIKKHGSISKAAKSLGMSYKYVWNYLNKIERALGGEVVKRERGGKLGGKTTLTELGEKILSMYLQTIEKINSYDFKIGIVEDCYNNKAVIVFYDVVKLKKGDKVILSILKR